LRKIEVKEDRETYTDFHDFGRWTGDSYAGQDNLPTGYWVYVAPHWYIWEKQNAKPTTDEKKATADGKYSVLLHKIEMKDDARTYGAFSDYGYWPGASYGGEKDLHPGYWVYVAPYWYIWGVAEGEAKPKADRPARVPAAKEKPAKAELKKASVDGKYGKL